jgi:hypothetical protein
MPIHQTKLPIAKPHATGMLTPQMPMPFTNNQLIAPKKTRTPANEMANAAHQPRPAGRSSTMSAMRSDTDA